MLKLNSLNGGLVEITRHETHVDMHLMAPDGRTVATVFLSHARAAEMVAEMTRSN